jgi:uncharacterized membrane protein YoaK (UPF0700 family)
VNSVERHNSWLAALLSATAGAVDVIGFQTLGLFTAHITGNIVVVAAEVVSSGSPRRLQILAIPVFMAAVATTWLIAAPRRRRGLAVAKPLLLLQCLLIGGVLLTSVFGREDMKLSGAAQASAALLAVSAMACQFATLRLALPGIPSTGVMTGNLTQIVLSALDTKWPKQSNDVAEEQLAKAGRSFVAFVLGCTGGALAVSWIKPWAWCLPFATSILAALTPIEG